jgi:Ca2+-binding RTX toxin-like protein
VRVRGGVPPFFPAPLEKGRRLVRRTTLLLGAMLTALVVAGGVAWAANVIQCPNDPGGNPGECWDTDKNDIVHGTSGNDEIFTSLGADIVYGYGGNDDFQGREGPDIYYGGPGHDYLAADCDLDSACGEDEKHGGPGNDHIVGNLRSEKHFGGRGDDLLVDPDAFHRNPDYFSCGPGTDRVVYNEGVDRVADDCEILEPY